MRYDPPMSTCRAVAAAVILIGLAPAAHANEPPSLAKARMLYNESAYEGAIDAAAVARLDPSWADAAALVIARAHLERYRQRADAADLTAARDALTSIRLSALNARDQVDLIVGLGQSLYLGEVYGAAAELFDTALARASILDARDRYLLLDWWATALDREAQSRPVEHRAGVFERISARMEVELSQDPANPVANYWRAVAARGMGDIDGAWHSAVAAWVRSTLSPESAQDLRADLDRLMTQALIPERSRTLVGRDPQEALSALRTEWEIVKEQWK